MGKVGMGIIFSDFPWGIFGLSCGRSTRNKEMFVGRLIIPKKNPKYPTPIIKVNII